MTIEITCVAPTRSKLGEGVVWDVEDQCLWWVDIIGGLVHRFDPVTRENKTYDIGEPVGCLAVRQVGGLVLATKSGFWFFDPDSGAKQAIHDPEAHLPENRFNDGTTDAQGRFWAGTMKNEGTPEPMGSFYRLDPDLSVTCWKKGVYTTNGLAFSPDGGQMYFSDSFPEVRKIWSVEYDQTTGTPGEPALFFDTADVPGRPDGGTVDADGCYWQAGVSGWQLYRLSPEGKILMTVDMPVEKPTKPMFGGPDLDVLYVTSIGTDAPDAAQPEAGSLFAVTGLGIKGLPQTRFAG